ncbi:MAG: pentapeptide repeat-containing protein [Pseudomonadota bacterium]
MDCCKCKKYGWEDPQEGTIPDGTGKMYCIFHAPAELKKGKEKELELEKAVYRRIGSIAAMARRERNDIERICNLSGTDFTCELNLAILDEEDDAFTFLTLFENCTFRKEVNCRHVQFHKDIYFTSSQFYKKVTFENAIFHSKPNFDYVIFESKSCFCKATFHQDVSFNSLQLYDHSDFTKTIFANAALFYNAEFYSNVIFYDTHFENDVLFNNATLDRIATLGFIMCKVNGNFIIDDATLKGRVIFDEIHTNKHLSFKKSNIGHASFKHSKFEEPPIFEHTNLKKADFIEAPIEDFKFMGCFWPESHGRVVTYDSRKIDGLGYFSLSNVENIDFFPEEKAPSLYLLEDLYRRLKKVAKDEMDERLVSDFHYAEKEIRRLRALRIFNDDEDVRHDRDVPFTYKEMWRALRTYIILCLYKLISGYGEAPFKAGGWLLSLCFLPLILLDLLPYPVTTGGVLEIDLWAMPFADVFQNWIYFFPLVKLPDASCAGGLSRLLMLISQIFITIQAALFGFALRNRFRR